MPLFVDEHITLRVRKAEKLLEDGVDLVNVVLVKDKALLSDVIAVGYNDPPPELRSELVRVRRFLIS
jgi:hypothetical protein